MERHPRAREVYDAAIDGDLAELTSLADAGVPVGKIFVRKRDTALHVLSEHGHIDCLEFILTQEPDLLAEDASGQIPLARAACGGQLDAVKLLIQKAPNSSIQAYKVLRQMLDKLREDDALWEDFEEIFHALVACRVNLTKSDSSAPAGARDSLLHNVARVSLHDASAELDMDRYFTFMDSLKSKSGSYNIWQCVDKRGRSILYSYLRHAGRGYLVVSEMFEKLLNLGVSAKHCTRDGATALHALCSGNDGELVYAEEIVTALIEAGVDRNAQRRRDGKTALHLAFASDDSFVTDAANRLLLKHGAEVALTDNLGRTVLHHIVSEKGVTIMAIFREEEYLPSAVLKKKDKRGWTALHAAASRANADVVRSFLHYRWMDMEARDKLGRTALHLVASLEGSEAVKCAETLIKEGADPLAEGQDGTSPLERSTGDVRTVLLRAAEGALKGGGPAAGLLLALHGMQRNGRHTDVTLACGTGEAKEKEEIRCHAVVLAAQGEFWETLCFGPMARPDGRYEIEEVSADTLRAVVDFCYSGALPEGVGLSALPQLIRAAHRFLMPPLAAACRVRAAGSLEAEESVFELHAAASLIGDEQMAQLIERFLLRKRTRGWVSSLVRDKEAWARLTERGAETSALLQWLLAKLLDSPAEGGTRSRKRRRGAGVVARRRSSADDSSRSSSDDGDSSSSGGSGGESDS